eukprot:m.91535 g.91535  ORF g.91535 m.91535 type:complete len:72 (-) comp14636_c1_seq4:437-652(-)
MALSTKLGQPCAVANGGRVAKRICNSGCPKLVHGDLVDGHVSFKSHCMVNTKTVFFSTCVYTRIILLLNKR